MNEKPLDLLGLMRRAGAIEIGTDRACDAIRAGKSRVVLIAADAAENAVRKLGNAADGRSTETLRLPFTSDTIAAHLGVGSCGAAAITDIGFAEAFLKQLAAEDAGGYQEILGRISAKSAKMKRRRTETKVSVKKKTTAKRRT